MIRGFFLHNSVFTEQIKNKNRLILLTSSFLFPLVFGMGCAQFNRITSPVSGCLRRAAIISIDIPPITLTPERTSAERQLIGENKELEENGWMIASARSVQKTGVKSKQIDSDKSIEAEIARDYFQELNVLEFYNDLLLEYRESGLLGESFDGKVMVVPTHVSGIKKNSGSGEEFDNARRVAAEINRSRKRLKDILKNKSISSLSEITVNFGLDTVRPGEWIYTKQRKWQKAR